MPTAGYPRVYGNPEPQKIIAAEIGRTKRSREPARAKKHSNDGRPPDTTAQLPENRKRKSAESVLITAKRAKPAISLPAIAEGADSDDSAPPASAEPPARDILTGIQALSITDVSTKITINGTSRTLVHPGPDAAFYVSYPAGANACWLDVALEILHILFRNPEFREYWKRLLLAVSSWDTEAGGITTSMLLAHLNMRQEKTELNAPKELRSLLKLSRNMLQRADTVEFGEMSSVWVCSFTQSLLCEYTISNSSLLSEMARWHYTRYFSTLR